MISLRGWKGVVLGGLVGSVAALPAPVITPAPEPGVDIWIKRQGPDALSFAALLLTAIPLSLRQIAATNAPAVSSILWNEFLDDSRPQWFLDLPYDIQSYLVKEFGPETARLPTPPTTAAQATPTGSAAVSQSSQATPSASYSAPSSASQSSVVSMSSTPSAITSSTSTRASASSSISNSTLRSFTVSASASSVASATPSATSDPVSPPASDNGLTRRQKIGLGVGIPFGIFGAAALLFGCCFLLRRKHHKRVDGSEPPSSPGFIPRFAFHDKSTDHFDHRAPLNPAHNHSNQDFGTMNWEDEGYDPYESTAYDPAPIAMGMAHQAHTLPPATAAPAMTMQDSQPIMAPVLYHTHSSNRARGKRTSYSSLHSVAEVAEPDEGIESPVSRRETTPLHRNRRPTLPMVLEMPTAPRAASIKRKPVPESPTAMSPAADAASQSLLRPAIRPVNRSGSSSSGLAFSTDSSVSAETFMDHTSPISPLSQHAPVNPFSNDYSYVEDYGPEYQSGYADDEDGLFGGHRSSDQYHDPSPPRQSSKTEWPLRNLSHGRRRERSPMWDRVYSSD